MNTDFIKYLVSKLFGTLIRHGLSVVGAWLIAHGAGELTDATQTNLTEIIVGLVSFVVSFGWSFFRHYGKQQEVDLLKDVALNGGFKPPVPVTPPPSIKVSQNAILGLFMAFAVGFSGCSVISSFDQNSYHNASELKGRALALMSKATVDSSGYTSEIESLKVDLQSAEKYEEGKGGNIITATQWKVIIDPDRNLLGSFLKSWQTPNKKFSEAYLAEKKAQVSDAFDTLIILESGKSK